MSIWLNWSTNCALCNPKIENIIFEAVFYAKWKFHVLSGQNDIVVVKTSLGRPQDNFLPTGKIEFSCQSNWCLKDVACLNPLTWNVLYSGQKIHGYIKSRQ